MKFRVKIVSFELTPAEKLRRALEYIRTKQIKKLFHITIGAPIKSRFFNGPLNSCIEPTSLCNARCALCSTPSEKLKRTQKFFPLNKFKEIIDEVKSCVRHVTFFVAGDPFINENLCEMISYATRSGLGTFVSTNGTLLNRQTIEKLLETNLDVLYVCLDGARKETHEIYRRGTNFELICTNIRALTSEKQKRKKIFPYIFIQTLITRYNEDELEDIVRLGKELGVDGVLFKRFGVLDCYDEDLAKDFLPRKKELSRYGVVDGRMKMEEGRDVECGFTKTALVLCDGRLAFCCYDYNGEYGLGNAFSESLTKLWKSKKYKDLRERMRRKELKICKEMCGVRRKKGFST